MLENQSEQNAKYQELKLKFKIIQGTVKISNFNIYNKLFFILLSL